jgi:UDP-N-acetylmuramoylalanine--D-glutamate ligase
VLELSSAMLYWLAEGVGYPDASGWSPSLAVLTNINPNHIDWHGSFDHYRDSKLNIFKYQEPGEIRVTGNDVIDDGTTIPLKIPGRHNQLNGRMMIATLKRLLDVPTTRIAEWLSDFPGLPHRLQLAEERDDLRFYNDSKSTTPEATLLAVDAFDDASKVHLITGGYDKGSDLTPIAQLAPRIAGLYGMGVTGPKIVASANHANAISCETLENAVETALERMQPGEVLLLSPGCASWDQFNNYEERGEQFVRLVQMRIAATAHAKAE